MAWQIYNVWGPIGPMSAYLLDFMIISVCVYAKAYVGRTRTTTRWEWEAAQLFHMSWTHIFLFSLNSNPKQHLSPFRSILLRTADVPVVSCQSEVFLWCDCWEGECCVLNYLSQVRSPWSSPDWLHNMMSLQLGSLGSGRAVWVTTGDFCCYFTAQQSKQIRR